VQGLRDWIGVARFRREARRLSRRAIHATVAGGGGAPPASQALTPPAPRNSHDGPPHASTAPSPDV
jgi:hypothetical protein